MVFWVEFLLVKSDAFTQELVEWKGELEKKKAIQKRGSIEFQRGFRSPKNTRTTTLQTLLSP